MVMTTSVLDVDQARVSKAADGSVVFDDPSSPWLLRMWTHTPLKGPPIIARLHLEARSPDVGITATRLAWLPITQMLHIAAAASAAVDAHPNEIYYRMLARPKRDGQRTWDPEHWDRVLTVDQWARDTSRPGGGARAVADLWGVAVNPTAYRWIIKANQLATPREQAAA